MDYTGAKQLPEEIKEEKSYYRLGYENFKDDKLISPDNFDKEAPVKAYQDYYRGALDAQIESAFYDLKTDFISWSLRSDIDAQQIISMLSGLKLAFIMRGISKA